MNKRTYIALTIICLIGIITLQTLYSPQAKEGASVLITKDKIADLAYSIPIVIIGLVYFSLFIAGIVLLIIFGYRKINNQNIIETSPLEDTPNPSSDKLPNLFFFMALYALIVYGLSIAVLHSHLKMKAANLSVLSNLVLQLGVITIILYFLSRKSLGFSKNRIHVLSLFKIYIAIIPILLSSLLLNTFILDLIGIKPTVNPAIGLFIAIKNKVVIAALVLEVIVLAPIVEEIFFRGIIYKVLRNRFSFTIAAIITSLFFSLIHRVPANILPLFIISFSLCYTYEKTKNIYSPIIFHSIHNTISMVFLLVLKSVM